MTTNMPIADVFCNIAVKVHCMESAAKIAMPFPKLRAEVRFVIEEQMKHGSAGIKSQGAEVVETVILLFVKFRALSGVATH
jgi:hypothetical protein